MRQIKVRLNPFSSTEKVYDFKEGDNLKVKFESILADNGIDEKTLYQWHVVINGKDIEHDLLTSISLEDCDDVLITPKLSGGDFGQTFKTVAIIAVTFTAAYFAGPSGLKLGSASASLFTAGATIGATLLFNSLIPPPQPPGLGPLGSSTGGLDSSQMYSLGDQSNQTKRLGIVPKVYGTFRMFPNVVGNPYTDVEVDNSTGKTVQVLNALYDFGLGPAVIDDIRIGDTPISDFADVQLRLVDPNKPDVNEGYWDEQLNKDFQLYKGDVENTIVTFEFTKNQVESGALAEDYRAIRNGPINPGGFLSEFNILLTFPAGLRSLNTDGTTGNVDIEFKVEFSKVTENVWRNFNDLNFVSDFSVTGSDPSGSYYQPANVIQGNSSSGPLSSTPYTLTHLTPWTQTDFNIKIPVNKSPSCSTVSGNSLLGSFCGFPTYRYRLRYYGYPVGTTVFQVESGSIPQINTNLFFQKVFIGTVTSISPSSTYPGFDDITINNGVTGSPVNINLIVQYEQYYLSDGATFYGVYEENNFEIVKPLPGIATIGDNEGSQIFASVKFTPREADQYKIRITRVRTTTAFTYNNQERATWVDFKTRFLTETVVTDKRHVFMEVKIRATNQLNGRLNNISGLVSSVLPVYDGTNWTKEITSNPAWIISDLLTGEVNKRAISRDRLNLDSLLSYATYCDQIPVTPPTNEGPFVFERFSCNFILDFETNLRDLINLIGSSNQCSLQIEDGKYGVLIDELKTVPVQVFTPRNYISFASSRSYVEGPQAVDVKFNNPNIDFQIDTQIVFDDGFDATTAERVDELESFGVTNTEQAWRYGKYMLAQNRLRQENISIEIDFEQLVCTRGDYVLFTQDVMRVGGRPARVKAVSGVRITIDDGIDTNPAINYGYTFRSATQGIITSTLTVVDSDEFDLDGTMPDVGDLIVIGEVGQVTLDCIVKDISAQDNLRATLTLVEKADGIFEALETGVTPVYLSNQTQGSDVSQVAPGEVENLAVTDNSFFFDNGYNYFIDLAWETPVGAAVELYEIYVDLGDGFQFFDTTSQLNYRYIVQNPEIELGVEHSFKVLALSSTGLKINLGEVGSVEATPERKSTPPSDVELLNINVTNQVLSLDWRLVPDEDINEYLIRFNPTLEGTWFTSTPLTRADRNQSSTSVQARVGTYLIKAIDFAGNESANATFAITSIPELLELNVVDNIDDFPAPQGSRDLVVPQGDALILQQTPLGDYFPEGFYNFEQVFDLGDIYTVRLQNLVEAEGYREGDLMSSWTTLASINPLASVTTNEWEVESQVRYKAVANFMSSWSPLSDVTTLIEGDVDDWSPWTTFIMGDFTARYFQFRLRLVSNVIDVTPRVLSGLIRADMPDRIEQDNNITSNVGVTSIVYNNEFFGPGTTPRIEITQDTAQSGDYYVITNRTLAGFDIAFYDSTDTLVSRTFDWAAAGWGRKNAVAI